MTPEMKSYNSTRSALSQRSLPAFLFIVALLSFASCRKVPVNGQLDGQWQIMTIETVADGTVTTPSPRAYIDINLHIMQLCTADESVNGGATITGNMAYDKAGATITVDFPYNTAGGNLTSLQLWGIHTNPVTFSIITLDNKELVLKTPDTIIRCRRY